MKNKQIFHRTSSSSSALSMMSRQAIRSVVKSLPLLLLLLYVVASAPASEPKPSPDQTIHESNQAQSEQQQHHHNQHHEQQQQQQQNQQQTDSQDTYMNYVRQQRSPSMQVHKLSSAGNNITCNDGSQIGYYKRLNQHSKSWVIYLQGGGFCGSRESCRQRWQQTPFLMSSKYWPTSKTGE